MAPEGETVGLVLAAGSARRFGRQKLLAEVGAESLVRRAVKNALASSLDRVLVVVGHRGEEVGWAIEGLPVTVVVNPEHAEGMGASIRRGVEAVIREEGRRGGGGRRAGVAALLVLLGDQPGVGPDLIDRVLAADAEGEAEIVAPCYRDGSGNPVLFRASVFPELRGLEGDRGARSVVDRDPFRVHTLRLDRLRPRDVDTPEDLRGFGEADDGTK